MGNNLSGSSEISNDEKNENTENEEKDEGTVNEQFIIKIDNIPDEMSNESVIEQFGNDLKIDFKRESKISKVNAKTNTRCIEVAVSDEETVKKTICRGNKIKLGEKYLQVFDYCNDGTHNHDNFIFAFQINTESETKIRNHFGKYGDILSVYQKESCSAKIQFNRIEEKDRALEDKDRLFYGERIIVQDSPIIKSDDCISLIILKIPSRITQNHILDALSDVVRPITTSFDNNRRTCVLTFNDKSELVEATRYLLTHKIENQQLLFSLFREKLLLDEDWQQELTERMNESGISNDRTSRILKNLSPYQIKFLVNHKNTSRQFIELQNME